MNASVQVRTGAQIASKPLRGVEPTRLAMLSELSGGELRVTDRVARLNGFQGTISGQWSSLKSCGLVADRPEGRRVFYRIARPDVVAVVRSADAIVAVAGHDLDLSPNCGPV